MNFGETCRFVIEIIITVISRIGLAYFPCNHHFVSIQRHLTVRVVETYDNLGIIWLFLSFPVIDEVSKFFSTHCPGTGKTETEKYAVHNIGFTATIRSRDGSKTIKERNLYFPSKRLEILEFYFFYMHLIPRDALMHFRMFFAIY